MVHLILHPRWNQPQPSYLLSYQERQHQQLPLLNHRGKILLQRGHMCQRQLVGPPILGRYPLPLRSLHPRQNSRRRRSGCSTPSRPVKYPRLCLFLKNPSHPKSFTSSTYQVIHLLRSLGISVIWEWGRVAWYPLLWVA